MPGPLNFHPALPAPTGPRPERAKFLGDVAAGLELLALFYAMSAAQQAAFIDFVRSASAGVANGTD
jgi:hypothetical protein